MDYLAQILLSISELLQSFDLDVIADIVSKYAGDVSNLSFPLTWENGHTIVLGVISIFVLFFTLVAIRTLWLGFWMLLLSWRIRWWGRSGKLLTVWSLRSPQPCRWYSPFCIIKHALFWWNKPYSHLWKEYRDTLHEYESEDKIKEWRATAPAEAFFTPETLVDNRFFVWSDFVRHLPGIITGLGIIGTFSGLIVGLDGFSPSEEASETRSSLSNLLGGVQEAFLVSAIAISCAIGITIIEKMFLAFCYGRVEKINHAIDSLYKTGAGEQYLERLVKADESNALQTKQLKTALVEDLKDILNEITDKQISAYKETGQHISTSLDGVKNAVSGQAATETHVIKDAMENLVAAFIEKMDNSIGGQMQDVKDAMTQSAQAIHGLETVLDRLVSDVGNSTNRAVEKVVQQMDGAMQHAAISQSQMTQEMQSAIEQLRNQFSNQQATSNNTLKEMLEKMLHTMGQGQESVEGSQTRMIEKTSGFMDQLTQQMKTQQEINDHAIKALLEQLNDGQNKTSTTLSSTVDELSTQLQVALKNIKTTQESSTNTLHTKLNDVLSAWDASIAKLNDNIAKTVAGMNTGAEKIEIAANNFEKAGRQTGETLTGASQTFKYSIDSMEEAGISVKDNLKEGGNTLKSAFENISPFANQIALASEKLKAGTKDLTETSNHFQEAGKQTQQQITELQQLMVNIKTEAGISSDMVRNTQKATQQLEDAIGSLVEAEQQAAKYLEQVNGVLKENFKLFGDEMYKQVEKATNTADQRLAEGVKILTGLAQEQSRLVKRINQSH